MTAGGCSASRAIRVADTTEAATHFSSLKCQRGKDAPFLHIYYFDKQTLTYEIADVLSVTKLQTFRP